MDERHGQHPPGLFDRERGNEAETVEQIEPRHQFDEEGRGGDDEDRAGHQGRGNRKGPAGFPCRALIRCVHHTMVLIRCRCSPHSGAHCWEMSTFSMTTGSAGLSIAPVGTPSISSTTFWLASSATSPKMVCLPLSHGVSAVV